MKTSKKVVILGHFGVGKSSLMRRFVEDVFVEDYIVTIGVHIMKKEIHFPDETITLILWDVEGIDDFTKYRPSYLLGSSSFIYVFDAARAATYKDMSYNMGHLNEKFPTVPVHVVANKMDLVEKSDLLESLNSLDIKCEYFASAKTGDSVNDLFKAVAKNLSAHAE